LLEVLEALLLLLVLVLKCPQALLLQLQMLVPVLMALLM
jgi:hypothetical protein